MQDLLTKDIEAHGNIRSEAACEFKDSPLGRIPKDWEVLRVEEVGSVRLGRQRSPKHQSGRFTTPYLRVANVFDGWIDYSDVLSMDFTPTEKEIYGLLPGDVLLNEGQSVELVGRSAMYEGEPNQYCFQNTLVRFRAFDENDPGYCQMVFKYWLDTGRFRDVASQTTSVAHLGADRFAQMPFPRPSLREQQAIYSVLKAKDDVIQAQQGYLQILHRVKTGLMRDLLTKGVDEHGNIRSEATHEFKDSPLGRIPKEWECEPFGEACEKVSVGIATSTTKHFTDNGIPLIRNQNVKEDGFDTSDILFITRTFDEVNKSKRLKPLDIVIVRTGYPGLSCVVPDEMEGWQTFTTLISRPRQDRYDSHFVSLLINSHVCKRQIANLQAGGAQQNLNVGWIVNMNILRPSKEEQARVARTLNSFAKSISNEEARLSKLRKLKLGLMQDLLTGKVSVGSLLAEREAAGYALP